MTAQNHGYAVSSIDNHEYLEVTHINKNDGTVSGMIHKKLHVFSIHYHYNYSVVHEEIYNF